MGHYDVNDGVKQTVSHAVIESQVGSQVLEWENYYGEHEKD